MPLRFCEGASMPILLMQLYWHGFVHFTILLKRVQPAPWLLTRYFVCCSLCSFYKKMWHTRLVFLSFFHHHIVIPIDQISQPHIRKSKFPLLLILMRKLTKASMLPTKNKNLESSLVLLAYNLSQWLFLLFSKASLGRWRSLYYHLSYLSTFRTL